MAQRMVMITNMVNGKVSIKDPAYGVNRRWEKRGQTIPVPFEAVENLLWQDGFRRMLEMGILYIPDLQTKKDLGLEPEEATEPVNIKALTEIQMKNLLTSSPMAVFKKELATLPRVQVDNLIEYAIEKKIVNAEKCAFLKKITNRDILAAIAAKEEEVRIDERERQRKEMYEREDGRRG